MLRHKVSAVVLAGGNSKRMGRNKALLRIGEKKMIQIVVETLEPLFDEVLLVTRNPSSFYMLDNVKFVTDVLDTEKKNSLVGLYSGLLKANNEYAFIVPCDMPFLSNALIAHMIESLDGEDVRIPMIGSYFEPLHAIYRKTCLPYISDQLRDENYKITAFYDHVLVRPVSETHIRKIDPHLSSFTNVNTEAEYLNAKARWALEKDITVKQQKHVKRSEKKNEKRRPDDILQ